MYIQEHGITTKISTKNCRTLLTLTGSVYDTLLFIFILLPGSFSLFFTQLLSHFVLEAENRVRDTCRCVPSCFVVIRLVIDPKKQMTCKTGFPYEKQAARLKCYCFAAMQIQSLLQSTHVTSVQTFPTFKHKDKELRCFLKIWHRWQDKILRCLN